MALTVSRRKGVVVEYKDEGVVFDPSTKFDYPAFVSHAHADHAAAFRYPDLIKYATEQTHSLLEAMEWKIEGKWRQISVGDKVKVGDIEVGVYNAGHILGSVQFEAATPEGTVLYTGDFSMGDSYTVDAAEPVSCDILVLETTFGAPMFSFPKRREIALEMVRWAVHGAVLKGMVPTFKTDSIGNAQEIITIFNRMTKLPVVTAKRTTKASDVYRNYGHNLDYVDADSNKGRELLKEGRCVLVTPKGSKVSHEKIDPALASGWAVIMKKRGGTPFPLSDHADFRGLISFIQRCHPKRVLTVHGGAMTKGFADYVKKRLGIDARPLTSREETLSGPVYKSATRIKACCGQLLQTIRIPGFIYTDPWLVKEMAKRGFTRSETENALQVLVERGFLIRSKPGVKLN